MKKAKFLTYLTSNCYSFIEEGESISINNQGSVYLSSLTTLPDGIQFNNQGSVYLSSLKNFDEIKAGNEARNLFVVYGPKYGLRISLGCFIGNEDEAINAIKKKYKGKDAPVYIHKVTSAFAKAKERYARLLVNHSTNI